MRRSDRLTGKGLDDVNKKIADDAKKPEPEKKYDIDIAALKQDLDKANEDIEKFKGSQKDLNTLIANRNKLQDEYNKLLGNDKTKAPAADKLSVDDKNNLNSDQAKEDNEKAQLELKHARDKEDHDLTVEEEVKFLNAMQEIDDRWSKKKIEGIKGTDAAEEAERAKINLKMIDDANKTNKEIEAVYKKDYDDKAAALKKQFETNVSTVTLNTSVVEHKPDASNTEIAAAKKNADDEILRLTTDYYNNLETLAVKNKQDATALEAEKQKAINEAIKKGLDDDKALVEARYKDIDDSYTKIGSSIRNKFNLQKDSLLANGTPIDSPAFPKLDSAENIAELTNEANAAFDKVTQSIQDELNGKISKEEQEKIYDGYIQAIEKLKQALSDAKPQITSLRDLLIQKLPQSLFDTSTPKGGSDAAIFAQTVSAAYDTAGNAMTTYFDNEQTRIQNSLKQKERLIDSETRAALAHAQSSAEQSTIDREAQAQKLAAEKAAFEQNKKLQREQAGINLAVQLSNLAVTAASPTPLNIVTGGAWGVAFYAVQAALAFINYGLNVSKINAAQFAKGGEVPSRGGRFGGKPHSQGGTPFTHQGNHFEAEYGEIAIVRTKDAPRDKVFQMVGTQSQIASGLNRIGGGVDFQPGARIKKFAEGGAINFNPNPFAPDFKATSYYTAINQSDNSQVVEEIKQLRQDVNDHQQSTDARFDRLQVQQVTSSVTSAQKKQVKQISVGRL